MLIMLFRHVVVFHVKDKSWSTLPWSKRYPSGAGVIHPSSFGYNGHFFVLGGSDTSRKPQSTMFMFDGQTWTELDPLPYALESSAATLYNI
jgi:hypothetical protein